jgi:hypothetical protein
MSRVAMQLASIPALSPRERGMESRSRIIDALRVT